MRAVSRVGVGVGVGGVLRPPLRAFCALPPSPRPQPRPWSELTAFAAPCRRAFSLGVSSRARSDDKRGDDEDAAFAALHAQPWYARLGTGAWLGLALVAGVGVALVYFFWQHRQERARCTPLAPAHSL